MNTRLRIKYIQSNRSLFDKLIVKILRGVFLRYVDRHLAEAHNSRIINNNQLHSLDAQMKGDLGYNGYMAVE